MTYAPSNAQYKAEVDGPLAGWEKELLAPRKIRIHGTRNIPADTSAYSIEVPLRDAIAAVQSAGYLVYEIGQLPEITVNGNGKPKLPARWGEVREGVDQRAAYYESAFGTLALARWWEQEAERRQKRVELLANDIFASAGEGSGGRALQIATDLVDRGWRRG